ncbi:MAG: Eco57I restriction-modification methylase domain-containing protein [Candidatus Hodarchaeota archaeon]
MVLNKRNYNGSESIGQIFTPRYIAKFMVNNVLKFIGNLKKNPRDIKVLETSVGKGIFLKYLIQNNFSDITAYEIDKNLKDYLLDAYPGVKFKFKNVLGSKINDKYDLIIGNPPYLGQNYNAEIFQEYVHKFPICKKFFVGNMDLFYFFIHLGILKLNPGGILSFITTNYWITKSEKTGIKLLKPHILDECFLLQYVDLSRLKLFKGAEGQHNCVFVIQKKNEQEKVQSIDKPIEIIQVRKKKDCNISDKLFNKNIFKNLIKNADSNDILRYESALNNRKLKREGSWNLIYPQEVKEIVDKIENFCSINSDISFLRDYFIIRNGLIFIKDNIFILNEGDNLKIKHNEYFVKVNNQFLKLSEVEKDRLKKIYKSKSIRHYGYIHNDNEGYAIYFNKNEFPFYEVNKRNQLYDKKYPVLTAYLKQFEKELREILIIAKENPNDFYFPRRGTSIRMFEKAFKDKLIDLEPLYENSKKIFLKYISTKNIFGYSDSPYFATSDTYFLWPRFSEEKINYRFILAYLNSRLVHFLFKAKNIQIKRSKTKLEYGLPIPNLEKFQSAEDLAIISLIRFLISWLIELHCSSKKHNLNNFSLKLKNLRYFSIFNQIDLMADIKVALKYNDEDFIQKIIDELFFQLFKLNIEEINYLLNKYYFF